MLSLHGHATLGYHGGRYQILAAVPRSKHFRGEAVESESLPFPQLRPLGEEGMMKSLAEWQPCAERALQSALAASSRVMAQSNVSALLLIIEPSRACAEPSEARASVRVRHGSRRLTVYRVKPDSHLRRLHRWPTALHLRP